MDPDWIRKQRALQRKSQLFISFLGIAQTQSPFPNSCVYERFICSQDRSTYFPAAEIGKIDRGNMKIAHRQMIVEIVTVAAQFLFWEYLSLCSESCCKELAALPGGQCSAGNFRTFYGGSEPSRNIGLSYRTARLHRLAGRNGNRFILGS